MISKVIPLCLLLALSSAHGDSPTPNILFFFADDWGRYASIYQDPEVPSLSDVIQTPHIDLIGQEGVVFENAFVPVASCGPCRASLATGSYFWRCGSGAFLNTKASGWKGVENPFQTLPKFVDLLADSGYHTARSGKTFAFTPTPGVQGKIRETKAKQFPRYGLYVSEAVTEAERAERHAYVIERTRGEIQAAMANTPAEKPFFFVFGPINVHRPYVADSGKDLWGIDPDDLKGLIPGFLPDVPDVRRDFSDYLGEVLALDLMLGVMLEVLEAQGKLDNTLVILSGDHGIPGVPRGKTNCYDLAVRAPLLMRLPGSIPPGRRVKDFVNLMDLGPTLLDWSGAEIPSTMNGKSFLPQLTSDQEGWIDPARDSVVVGRERHYHDAREGNIPFPMRAIRTDDYLYIRNFKPERWPMGRPADLGPEPDYELLHTQTSATMSDLDASLTKAFLFTRENDPEVNPLFELTLGKRPAEELYDLRQDPDQMTNLAANPEKAAVLEDFRERLDTVMQDTEDPRLEDAFDYPPYSVPGLPVKN